MIYNFATFLFSLSIIGGTVATAFAATGSVPQPVFLAQLDPHRAAEWVPVIANAIPAIGGALLLLYANYRQTRRKADADDDKSSESLRDQLKAMTADRDRLKAELAEVRECKPDEKAETDA